MYQFYFSLQTHLVFSSFFPCLYVRLPIVTVKLLIAKEKRSIPAELNLINNILIFLCYKSTADRFTRSIRLIQKECLYTMKSGFILALFFLGAYISVTSSTPDSSAEVVQQDDSSNLKELLQLINRAAQKQGDDDDDDNMDEDVDKDAVAKAQIFGRLFRAAKGLFSRNRGRILRGVGNMIGGGGGGGCGGGGGGRYSRRRRRYRGRGRRRRKYRGRRRRRRRRRG